MVLATETAAAEPILRPQTIVVVYWVIIVLLAAFFLRMACGICRTTLPSWRRAVVSVVIVTLLGYLAFDFTAYLIMRSMDGVLLQVPPWYSYNFWFREPLGLKLYIISYAGLLHYLPFVIALCVAGFMQVIVLEAEVTFRIGLLIFVMEAFATVVAGNIVAMLLGLALYPPGAATPQPAPGATGAARAPGPRSQGAEQAQALTSSLQLAQDKLKDHLAASQAYFAEASKTFKTYADSQLDELKKELAPFTKHLPPPVQKFLDDGGWWYVLGGCALVSLLWLKSMVSKFARGRSRRRKKKKHRAKAVPLKLKEDLAMIGNAYTEEGSRRLLVKGLPCRLRLVILSLGNRNPGGLSDDMADRVLDWIKPGMAHAVSEDYPRVRVWPAFYNAGGFANAFATNVPIPEGKGMRSNWVLVSGQVKLGLSIINVGLALYADEESTLRNLTVKGERWLDVLTVKGSQEALSKR